MSDKLGPLTFGKKEEEIFLGREISQHRDYSENTAIMIDDEVRKIVNRGMERATKVLNENTDTLHRLSAALLEREILDSDEIDRIMKGEVLPPFEKIKVNGETAASTNGTEEAGKGLQAAEEKSADEPKK
jgi:cell division protease FtsH